MSGRDVKRPTQTLSRKGHLDRGVQLLRNHLLDDDLAKTFPGGCRDGRTAPLEPAQSQSRCFNPIALLQPPADRNGAAGDRPGAMLHGRYLPKIF